MNKKEKLPKRIAEVLKNGFAKGNPVIFQETELKDTPGYDEYEQKVRQIWADFRKETMHLRHLKHPEHDKIICEYSDRAENAISALGPKIARTTLHTKRKRVVLNADNARWTSVFNVLQRHVDTMIKMDDMKSEESFMHFLGQHLAKAVDADVIVPEELAWYQYNNAFMKYIYEKKAYKRKIFKFGTEDAISSCLIIAAAGATFRRGGGYAKYRNQKYGWNELIPGYWHDERWKNGYKFVTHYAHYTYFVSKNERTAIIGFFRDKNDKPVYFRVPNELKYIEDLVKKIAESDYDPAVFEPLRAKAVGIKHAKKLAQFGTVETIEERHE